MSKTAVLAVRIVSDAKQAVSGMGQVESATGRMGKLARAAGAGLLVAGGAAAAFTASAVQSAGDLEQSIGAVDTVFKGSAGQIHQWAKSAATDVGLTRNEYNELGTLIGTQLKNGGVAMDQLAPKTNDLIKMGSDLSSMFGGTTKEAVEALSSALKGERDPIEKYGVSLNQARIDAEAARLGFKKVGGSLSAEANQAATLSLIMKQTADAHGNFGRESDTLAHQQQVLMATVGNLKTELGMAFLPIVTKVFGFLNDTAVPAVKNLFGWFKTLGAGAGAKDMAKTYGLDKLATLGRQLLPMLRPLGAMFGALVTRGILPLVKTLAANLVPIFTKVASIVFPAVIGAVRTILPALLPAVQAIQGLVAAVGARLIPVLNWLAPIVTTVFGVVSKVVAAALGVVSGIIRTVTSIIKGDWSGAWENIKQTVAAAWKLIKTIVTGAGTILKTVLGKLWGLIKAGARAAWDGVVSLVKGAWNRLQTAVNSGIAKVAGYVRSLPGKLKAALGRVGDLLLRQGRAIIEGFLRGLKQAWEDVKSFVGGIGSWIADHKGPLSYDRKLLQPAGQAIMDGLRHGLRSSLPELRRTLGLVTDTVAGTQLALPGVALPAGRAARTLGAATVVNVNVTFTGVVTDKVGTAREIENLVRQYGTGGTIAGVRR